MVSRRSRSVGSDNVQTSVVNKQAGISARLSRYLLPSATDIVFGVLVLISTLGMANRMLNSDGDLARHIRVGNYILDHHGLFYSDIFSFTVAGKSFVPYEWLSEIIFALCYRLGGLPAIAVMTGLVGALTYTLVTVFLRRRGVDALLALGGGILAAFVSLTYWVSRPHLFTSLATILLVMLLERQSTRRRDLWLFGLLFALWANLHGGFLYGLILIALYIAGDVAELLFGDRGVEWRGMARFHAASLFAALIGCCLNPTGPLLFRHVTGYLGETFLVDHTNEYRSPNFHEILPKFFLATLLLIVAGLAMSDARPRFARLLTLLVAVAFTLVSARNMPLFAVSALPLMVIELDPVWRQISGRVRRVRESFETGSQMLASGAWSAVLAAFMLLVASGAGTIGGTQIVHAEFNPATFPVTAVNQARAAGLHGRIYNDFIWGGYLLYAWPEQKVFIDGQTDLYGPEITETYLKIADLQPGWRDLLDKWDISLLIVRSDSPLASEAAHDGTWSVWYCDATAAILQRGGTDRAAGIQPDCALR